jgi:hypothetical protein
MRKLLMIALGLWLAPSADAAVPKELTVQGVLRDGSGALQSAAVSVTVKFFDAQTAGNQVPPAMTYGPASVMAANGLFTNTFTLADADVTALGAAPELWMEVTAGGDVFPRQKVGPVMYALAARTCETVANGVYTSGAQSIDGSKTFTANLSAPAGVTGNVMGDVSGNAGSVTNGVYTVGDQSIAGNKTFTSPIVGNISGNAQTVTNGVYTSGDQTIAGNKTFSSTIAGSINGNAATVTNGVYTTGNQSIAGNKTFTNTATFTGTQTDVDINWTDITQFGRLLFNENNGTLGVLQYLGKTYSDPARQLAFEVYNASAGPVSIWTKSAERMRVDAAGNVGIGTNNPTFKLDVEGGDILLGDNPNTNPNGRSVYLAGHVFLSPYGTGTTAFIQARNKNNTGPLDMTLRTTSSSNVLIDTMHLDSSGNVTVAGIMTAAGYAASSDARLKTNVKIVDHALDALAKMRGVRFNWKSSGAPSMGVIAQEVEKVFPEIVATDPAGMKSVTYDAMSGVFIEAIKELRGKNDALAQENQALRMRLDTIERNVERLALAPAKPSRMAKR